MTHFGVSTIHGALHPSKFDTVSKNKCRRREDNASWSAVDSTYHGDCMQMAEDCDIRLQGESGINASSKDFANVTDNISTVNASIMGRLPSDCNAGLRELCSFQVHTSMHI